MTTTRDHRRDANDALIHRRLVSLPRSRSRRPTTQEENNAYTKSDAVLRIATYLENPLLPAAGAVGPLFPRWVRDAVYDAVADNRYQLLGMKDECRLGDDRFDERFVE